MLSLYMIKWLFLRLVAVAILHDTRLDSLAGSFFRSFAEKIKGDKHTTCHGWEEDHLLDQVQGCKQGESSDEGNELDRGTEFIDLVR